MELLDYTSRSPDESFSEEEYGWVPMEDEESSIPTPPPQNISEDIIEAERKRPRRIQPTLITKEEGERRGNIIEAERKRPRRIQPTLITKEIGQGRGNIVNVGRENVLDYTLTPPIRYYNKPSDMNNEEYEEYLRYHYPFVFTTRSRRVPLITRQFRELKYKKKEGETFTPGYLDALEAKYVALTKNIGPEEDILDFSEL